jgi:hypothetical protein
VTRGRAIALALLIAACERTAPATEAPPSAAAPVAAAPVAAAPVVDAAITNPAPADAAPDAVTGRNPMAGTTFRARVEAELGAGYRVSPIPWHGPPALELYAGAEVKGRPDVYLGVVATADRIARGKAGMPLVVAATQDPLALAEAAALLVVGGPAPRSAPAADPFDETGPSTDPVENAIEPPRVAGGAVIYWGKLRHGRAPLARITVDLKTLTVSDQGPAAPARSGTNAGTAPGMDPIDLAVAKIASGNQTQEMQGVDELIRLSSKNPAARAALERSLAVAKSADARTAAIYTLAKAPGAGTVAALIAVVSGDADPKVRRLAAMNLGRLRSQEARPALEAAASSDSDAAVRSIAAASLKQLDGK